MPPFAVTAEDVILYDCIRCVGECLPIRHTAKIELWTRAKDEISQK